MSTKDKALELLSRGLAQETVASALGVSPSAISQYMAEPEFANTVAERKFKTISKASSLDEKYDDIEDDLLSRFKKLTPTLMRPGEILGALKIVNAAKRRGTALPPDASNLNNRPVAIVLPQIINQKFVLNVNNQILQVNDSNGQAKSLVTATSAGLNSFTEDRASRKKLESDNSETSPEGSSSGSFRQIALTANDL